MKLAAFTSNTAFEHHIAVIAPEGRFTYGDLWDASHCTAVSLLGSANDLAEARVAFLAPPGFAYVTTLLGIWRAGGIAVPLCPQHPVPELAYVLDDAAVSMVVVHPDYARLLQPLAEARGLRFISTEVEGRDVSARAIPGVAAIRRALILYTSGTTGKPKGVVTTHANIAAQINSLVTAWEWTESDHILNVLPLHHIHGIINVLGCALSSGATWETLAKFDATAVWQRLIAGGITLFMAVPTIYARLIAAFEAATPQEQQLMRQSCAPLRLMVSGSAALPVATLEKWRAISGHTLLERYGMTEIGMALSNPLHGARHPGCVGTPLPGVQVRIMGEGTEAPAGTAGEIQVRGATVFQEYWEKQGATREAFADDGWFHTGDVGVCEDGIYRILGRESVDIIKSGGYKISALEIEDVLRTHPAIAECAVVGIADAEWGQRVAAVVMLRTGASLETAALRAWSKQHLAIYKVPTMLLCVDELPRNAMGKVTKPALVNLFNMQ